MPVCVKSEGHFFLHGRVDTAVVRISFSLREVLSRLSQYCWPCISSFLTAITVSPPPFCKSIYFSRFLHIWLKLLLPLFLFLHLTILVHSLHFAWLSSIISSLVIVTTTDPPLPFQRNLPTRTNSIVRGSSWQAEGSSANQKKFSAFYGNRFLITAFTKTHYLFLS